MNEGGRGEGQLYSVADDKTDLIYQYSYDSQGRLMSSSVTDVSNPDNPVKVITTRQTYDANNQLTGQQWRIGTTNYSESYTYSKTTGLLATHKPAVGNTLTYGYDALQRLSSVTGGIYGKTYTYRDISGTDKTTTQVSQLKYSLPTAITYGYTYDALGNIATYTEAGTTYTYTYDAQNQLTSVKTNGAVTHTYEYDAAGNIKKATNATGTHTYTYETGVWKDLLKSFDGGEITYDNAGNPTSYYNGTEWNMTWAEGRRLVSASGDGKSLTFTYDSDGLRLTKKVGNTTYQYYYAGGKLMRQTGGGNTLDFFYDTSGNPYALKYNNTLYYYITNLQGDVLHIVNTSGTPVVSYTYSPYGEPTTVKPATNDALATANPLRYRGYVYDTETGLYYLQSRYYDPTTGRFINADVFVSTGQGLLGNNMFAYCRNNPVSRRDAYGTEDASVSHIDDNNPLNDLGRSPSGGSGGTGGSFWSSFTRTLQCGADGLKMAMGSRNLSMTQTHHLFSDKSKKYTPQFQEIFDRYAYFFDDPSNTVSLPGHRGRHTNAYHDFMLEILFELDMIADGSLDIFIEGMEIIGTFIEEYFWLPYARK